MKSVQDYLSLPYRLELYEDKEVGGYTVAVPELPECLTCGETLAEAMENIADAKKAWLEAALRDGYPIPEPKSFDDYSGQFKLRLPKSLHKELAEHAKREGISLNQYCVYLLSKGNVLHAS